MKGAAPDLSAATYQIHDETHTVGNALRWMLMKKCVRFRLFTPVPPSFIPEQQPQSGILWIQVNISTLSPFLTLLPGLVNLLR